jgi:hypothetical protein
MPLAVPPEAESPIVELAESVDPLLLTSPLASIDVDE